jgi:hypothetical protein
MLTLIMIDMSRVTSGFGASLSGDAYKAFKTGIEVKDPEEKVKDPLIETKRVLKVVRKPQDQ